MGGAIAVNINLFPHPKLAIHNGRRDCRARCRRWFSTAIGRYGSLAGAARAWTGCCTAIYETGHLSESSIFRCSHNRRMVPRVVLLAVTLWMALPALREYRQIIIVLHCGGSPMTELQAKVSSLSIFKTLDAGELASIAGQVQWLSVVGGWTLISEGDEARDMFVVVSGRLGAFKRNAEGNLVLVGQAEPGETVGEMALLSNER